MSVRGGAGLPGQSNEIMVTIVEQSCQLDWSTACHAECGIKRGGVVKGAE